MATVVYLCASAGPDREREVVGTSPWPRGCRPRAGPSPLRTTCRRTPPASTNVPGGAGRFVFTLPVPEASCRAVCAARVVLQTGTPGLQSGRGRQTATSSRGLLAGLVVLVVVIAVTPFDAPRPQPGLGPGRRVLLGARHGPAAADRRRATAHRLGPGGARPRRHLRTPARPRPRPPRADGRGRLGPRPACGRRRAQRRRPPAGPRHVAGRAPDGPLRLGADRARRRRRRERRRHAARGRPGPALRPAAAQRRHLPVHRRRGARPAGRPGLPSRRCLGLRHRRGPGLRQRRLVVARPHVRGESGGRRPRAATHRLHRAGVHLVAHVRGVAPPAHRQRLPRLPAVAACPA